MAVQVRHDVAADTMHVHSFRTPAVVAEPQRSHAAVVEARLRATAKQAEGFATTCQSVDYRPNSRRAV